MEEWNAEILMMMRDLQMMKFKQKNDPLPDDTTDDYGYALEAEDSFSTDPLGFVESTMKLETVTAESFKLLRMLNRHSPLFYNMAATLEKHLSQLGSLTITAAVMEQRGEVSRLLQVLDIETLRQRTAFVFRKCYASCMESLGDYKFNGKALSLSLRFAGLDRRLQATEEKIKLIRAGKISIDLCPEEKSPEKSAASAAEKTQEPAEMEARPFPFKTDALPIVRTPVQALLKQNESGPEAAERSEERYEGSGNTAADSAERLQAQYETAADPVPPETEGQGYGPECDPDEKWEEIGSLGHLDGDEENLPFVSEDLVRRMSEMIREQEMAYGLFPDYEYAGLDPPG